MEIIRIANKLKVYGISAVTDNTNEKDKHSAKIPSLWRKFIGETYDGKSQIYTVYSDYESDCDGEYKICIGTQNKKPNLEQVEIDSGMYAVFSAIGIPKQTVPVLWNTIWKFFQDSDIVRKYKSDFELYDNGGVKIYIGIKGTK